MSLPQGFKKIGILHHAGGSNLGDEASISAVIQNITRRWPGAALSGISMNPEDTRSRHKIPAYPMRRRLWNSPAQNDSPAHNAVSTKQKAKAALSRYPFLLSLLRALNLVVVTVPMAFCGEVAFLLKSFRIMRSLDLLVISGGGQFVESSSDIAIVFGGPWQFPYTMFKWMLLARFAHVKCIALNVGVGPVIRPASKWFVRQALFFADYASFRDEESRTLVRRIGFKGQTHVFPDNAYSLDTAPWKINPVRARARNKAIVGLAPMAYGDPRLSPHHDPILYNSFIQQLGMLGSWLIESGYRLTLFCTDISLDPPALVDVQKIIRGRTGSLCHVHQGTTEELLQNMSSMDYVVACRFHAVVLAHLLNIPVLAIAHHPKITALMNDLGLAEYCVDIGNRDLGELTDRFSSLVTNRDRIKNRMAERLALYKGRLSVQFDELFPPPCEPVPLPEVREAARATH
jgi:polysaccharide pyruvyl transferase WcaK-like protein